MTLVEDSNAAALDAGATVVAIHLVWKAGNRLVTAGRIIIVLIVAAFLTIEEVDITKFIFYYYLL